MRKLVLLLFVILFTSNVIAQVANYRFSQSSGTFTPIVGGTVLGLGGINLDEDVYNALSIGFNFTFNGTVFNQFSINDNGWLCMGFTAANSYTPISSGTSNNVITAASYDIQGLTTGELRYQLLGSAPNRTLVVQWLHFAKWPYNSTGLGDDWSFQIRLNETSNSVNIVYGSFTVNANSRSVQVGLRGLWNADFNNRTTTNNWASTQDGTLNTSNCTLSNTVYPASGLTFTYTPPPVCTTPAAQPTSLVLTPALYSMAVSFTASATAYRYLVVQSLNSSLSATPVNGTTYPVGTAFGGGTVVYWGTSTNFTSTGLTPNTRYYYFIFAANTSCTGGTPPLYRTASPLTDDSLTLPLVPISGIKTVGPTGDFFTLTAAFQYLNLNGVTGPVKLVLQSTYLSSNEPAFPIPANSIPGASVTNKITVYPSVSGLSITSNSVTGTLNLDGASYIYFDGRVNATGNTKDLVIQNTSSGYTIQLVNGATYNSFKNCIVKGSSQSSPMIGFRSTNSTSGNSYNTIDSCELSNGAANPVYPIYSVGSVSSQLYNSNNTISNCLIHDFYAANGGQSNGIYIVLGSTNWTITGNSFYQTTAKSPTFATTYNAIYINSGDGYTITNNNIGGSAPLCAGSAWTLNGNGTPPTIANIFYGIHFGITSLTSNPSSVQGNRIANISLFTNPTAANTYFSGIYSENGIQNIGEVSPNIIGSATGNGSITINVGTGAFQTTISGIDFRGLNGKVNNNTVGGFTLLGAATSTAITLFRGLYISPTVQNGPIEVSGNLVGSLTTSGSIKTAVQTNPPVILLSLWIQPTGSGSMTVNNNTIANLSNLSSNTGSALLGIYNVGSSIPHIVRNNTIRDFTTTSLNATLAGISSIVGIYSNNTVPGSIIRSNNIYNLTNTTATAAVGISGIYLNHNAGTVLVEKNFIHNIGLSTSSATAQVNGIYLALNGANGTIKNNMIQLGINPDGTPNTSSCIIYGIYEASASLDSVLNNSIYIGGAPAAGVTGNTYAFYSQKWPDIAAPRVCVGNIFYNARSGGSTGKHYGIYVTSWFAAAGVTSNYNLIYASGSTGGTFGSIFGTNYVTISAFKGASGLEMASGSDDPNFIAPDGSSSTVNLHVQSPTPIEGAGIALANVTDDFDGSARSTLTPSDIGADAGNFTLSSDVFGPNISYVPLGNGSTSNRVLTTWATIKDNVGVSTGTSRPRLYYKKSTDFSSFVGNTSADNGWKYVLASNTTSPYSFTIDYSIIRGGSVVGGNTIQYFVVAQDASSNISSNYPMVGFGAIPPIQNINAAPGNIQSYNIVSGTIPNSINVPGTYPTLTGVGGAFDMINQGVLTANTTIYITADLTEPGTIALNPWVENVQGANYKLYIKPDGTTQRTISGTAVSTGVAMIRTNGASRFIIDGGAGKYLTFRNTNATPANTGPTIQFNNNSINDTIKNCIIENNATSNWYGSINIGNNGTNSVVISGNDIRDATGGTAGLQATAIYTSTNTNLIKILNNNIYNFNSSGINYANTVADGTVISGNSFYYNSATLSSATQYCIYFYGYTNNCTISNNYFGGQAPMCGGSAWTNSTTNYIYTMYLAVGINSASTISNNIIQNFNFTNTGWVSFYGIYISGGAVNISNNLVGSRTVLNSITIGGTGQFYGMYVNATNTVANNIQGNTVTGISITNTTNNTTHYCYNINAGLVNVGTTSPNIAGSDSTAGSISNAGTGAITGINCQSSNPGNAIENNIIGNWSLTAASGSPQGRGITNISANCKKNKIFKIQSTNAALTPVIYGILTWGSANITNEYSNNLISLDGGAATSPTIYGFIDGSPASAFYNLYFNSVYISGAATTSSNTMAFYRNSSAFYTLKNNIFANTRPAGGAGRHYALYFSASGNLISNNNDLYTVAVPLGYYNGVDQANFAAWKTATGVDAKSLNVNPQFVSKTDLHTGRQELVSAGVTIPGITTDYDSIVRSNPPDIGAFEIPNISGKDTVCVGSTGNVYTCQPGFPSYNWAISAGGTITSGAGTNQITVSWNTVGSQTITLNTISVRTFIVRPLPVSSFTINNNSQCLSGNSFTFTNTATGASSYLWNFGDATATSTVTSPTHSYGSNGNYSVKLISTTNYGCKDSITNSLNVRPQPVSNFTINNNSQCLSGNNFAFTNTATGASTYLWNFGDATATTTTTSPSHSYSAVGSYTVKLVSTSSYGCKDSITKTLNVRPQPVSGFTINNNSQCISGNNFAFTNTATGASTYLWNFGDATATSTSTSPSHSYTTAGSYTVKLVSTSTYGCKDSNTKTLDVRPKPVSGFTINNNSQCLSGNNFAFTNTATGATTYLWNFGDATATSTSTSPTHSYTTAGSYTVKLVSTSTYGCKDSNTKTLDVRPKPVSGFTINNNSQCLSGNNFAFTNTTTGAATYLWNFGDATATSTTISPSHSYTAIGTYTVKLVSTSSYGCKDSNTKTLDVRPQPVSGFTINNNSQCLSGNNFAFTNTATGATTYRWNFGDATATSTTTSPSHSYTAAGTFSVKLVSTSSYGCKDSNSKSLDVRSHPVVGFTINNNSQCINGNNFIFTNSTTGATSQFWDFGDTYMANSLSPSHTYTSVGSYTVKLVSTSAYGCKDSISKSLNVRPQPVSGFTINNNSQCLSGNNFAFTNTATGAATYLWNFGDATATSTTSSPSHSYTTAGSYTVKLVSTTSYGCKDSNTKTLDVRPQPVSGFTINNNSQCLTGNNFAFTNTTTGASTYLWNFGDATATSTTTSPSHSYTTAGSYTVKLLSTTTYGCKDSITKTLDVRPKPVSGFTINNNSQCLSGNNFAFTNTATGASTYLWNFGDATATSTSTSPSHSYTAVGSYTVKLVSTSSYGCKDSNTKTLDVRPQPVSGFTINNNSQCLSGNNFAFTNTATGASTYLWNFGDATATTTITSPSHSYTSAGTFTVKLVSITTYGCKDSNTKTLDVRPKPVSGFTINNNSQCLSGNNFAFTNTTTGASTYLWNFGDATATSTSTSPSHSYTAVGSYTVKLVSTTSYGCKDSNTKTLDVRPQPVSGFTINNNSQCLSGNNFAFTNTATGASTYLWSFGDATATSTSTSPSHSYSAAGSYTVKLVSTTTYGCKDSNTKTLDVRPQPVSGFTINNNSQCLSGNSFAFTNTATGASTYLWNFGDATATSTSTSPSHSYTAIGSYTVKLVSTTSYGCKDSNTKTLDVRPQPVSGFSINNNSQCLSGNNFAFTNTATGASTYMWNFGDATATTTVTSPSHTYTSAGSYTVKLISTTTYGCKDSNTKTLDVRPQPVSGFTINNNSQCLSGNSFAFTNTATGASTYLWNFGDATATTTVTSPTHTYTAVGSYTVKLVSTTTYGCKDSTTKILDVRPQPTAAFTINNNSQCLSGNNFAFTNTATGASTAIWNFGDATATSTVTSPSHTYTADGAYTVKLVSTTTYGCKDSTTKTLDVRPQPQAGFTINNNSQCLSGNNFSFTDTSKGASTVLWNFGDATATTTVTSPSHTYTSAGTFTVKLVSTTTYGCKDSTTKTLDVRPQPTAAFSINNNSQCLSGNSFAFTNTASGASTALWNFGDATATTTVTSPSHTYTSAGTFTVKLVSTTTYGCKDSTTKTLDVRPQPVSGFTINNNSQCLSGNNFTFTNTATGASTYLWNFGDATSTSTTISPSHSYTTADSFIVKLVSATTYGCMDSTTTKLYVRPQPVSSFTINNNSQCLSGNSFVFTNTATGASTALWNFGDATATSTTISPSHTYTTVDSFIVKLISETAYGCKDSTTNKLYVRPQPVTAFTINDTIQCFSKNSFSFTNNSTISSGSLTNNWNFGDTTFSTSLSPTMSYKKSGNYVVKLVTTSGFGCKDSTTKLTYVDPSPTALFAFNADKQCFRGNLFSIVNNSSISGGSINAFWKFGDGDTTSTYAPSHTYLTSDTFQVSLLITSDKLCADSIAKTAIVLSQPIAGFKLSNTGLCLKGNVFTLTDTSSTTNDTIAVYSWYFGDGNSDTVKNSIHSYATDGNFNLKHIVTGSNGCKDSVVKTVSVYPQPKASFTINDTNQCFNGHKFVFTNTSTISSGNVNYLWNLGDGTKNSDTNNSHSYTTINNYQVWLKVISLQNCTDSISHSIYLKANPKVYLGVDTTIKNAESLILNAGTGFAAYLWSNSAITNQITVDSTTYGLGVKTFWVKVTQNGCDGFDTIKVTIIKTVSIEDPQSNFELKVYPNPVSSTLNMELSPVAKEMLITLTDMNGKLLKSIRIMPDKLSSVHQIDVSELAKGVYYLNISNAGTREVTKIVKY